MKKLNLGIAGLLFLAMITLFSCKKTDSPSLTSGAGKGSVNSGSSFGDYTISTSVSSDGTVWTYTINRAKASAKNLSHLIIDLGNCGEESATFADIISATLNGAPANLAPTEGSGTGCDPQASTNNFVKINFTASTTNWVLVITYDRGYETFATAKAWLKAGTSCNTGTIAAPGCPKTAYCSFSQGFFFAGGNNGAEAAWTAASGLTIGGVNYSYTEGLTFWDLDKGKGGNQGMNAFFQLGAVRLSGVESQVATDAALIDLYFLNLNVNSTITNGGGYNYFNLPNPSNGVTKAQVTAAGSAIGTYIDDNHCL